MTTFQFPSEVIYQAFEKFQATLSTALKFQFNGRLERGLHIALTGGVSTFDESVPPEYLQRFKVRSSNLSNPPYTVDLEERSCTCPDHWNGHFCKHRIAANIIKMAIQAAKVTSPTPYKDLPKATAPKVETQTNTVESTPIQPSSLNKQKESIIWAVINHEGKVLGVEVVVLENGQATVRALPKIIDGKKLQPQFPFEGKRNTTTLPQEQLSRVTVFQ